VERIIKGAFGSLAITVIVAWLGYDVLDAVKNPCFRGKIA
jgi:hypothetical protein